MEQARILELPKNSAEVWLGVRKEGLRPKAFRIVETQQVGANGMAAMEE